MKVFKTALMSACLSIIPFISSAQTVVVDGARLVTNTDQSLDNAVVKITDGKITSIREKNPNDAADAANETISGSNYWVTPLIFAPYSQVGLTEVNLEGATNDIRGDADHSVSIRASDSFNPYATNVGTTRAGGVGYAAIMPGPSDDLFGGQGAVVNMSGALDSIVKDRSFVYMSLNSRSKKAGKSKGAALNYLRNALGDAQNYPGRFKSPSDGNAILRTDAAALRPVVQGQWPLIAEVERAADIHNLLKLVKNYPYLKLIILGGNESWMLADKIAAAKVPVIIDPLENLPYDFDTVASRSSAIKTLIDAGVKVAIMARSAQGGNAHNLRLLPQHAGNAVTAGLSWEQAFAAISSVPAEIFGVSSLGKIKTGDAANLIVWDGDPLEVTSTPIAMYIDGKQASLESRQTALRDRYNPTRSPNGPYGYPR